MEKGTYNGVPDYWGGPHGPPRHHDGYETKIITDPRTGETRRVKMPSMDFGMADAMHRAIKVREYGHSCLSHQQVKDNKRLLLL